jgi:hypothetical protein
VCGRAQRAQALTLLESELIAKLDREIELAAKASAR